MAIYFLRHGQSQANVDGLFAGQREDSELTDLGKEQASTAGAGLADKDIVKIISSPLRRARKTAEIVAQALGTSPVEFDDRLLEYDMGSLTGQPHTKVTSRELIAAEGAEDPVTFQNRVLSFLREHKDDEGNLLIVSHAGVGRTIEAARQGIDPADFYDLPAYPNAQAVLLDLDWLK